MLTAPRHRLTGRRGVYDGAVVRMGVEAILTTAIRLLSGPRNTTQGSIEHMFDSLRVTPS